MSFNESIKFEFDDQTKWEQAALDRGYTIKSYNIVDTSKHRVILKAETPDGDLRGLYVSYLRDSNTEVHMGYILEEINEGQNHD